HHDGSARQDHEAELGAGMSAVRSPLLLRDGGRAVVDHGADAGSNETRRLGRRAEGGCHVTVPGGSDLTPPSDLICTSEEHLYKGQQWVEYFSEVCGLRPDESVLDVGSGGGRVAIPLSEYLTAGRYEGFDTSAPDVQWCREHISPRAPNFNFQHVNVFNRTY